MKRNVTLSLEKSLVQKGKKIASKRDTSLSRIVGDMLQQVIRDEESYEASKKKALRLLNKGFHFGGKITCTRDELHAR
jgi:hypothetical protein